MKGWLGLVFQDGFEDIRVLDWDGLPIHPGCGRTNQLAVDGKQRDSPSNMD